jgi:hypothetical protein
MDSHGNGFCMPGKFLHGPVGPWKMDGKTGYKGVIEK